MNHIGCRSSRQRGFTLVEILVVVAILALLSAILFSVYSKVSNNGRQLKCTNHLMSIGQAISMYADDHSGIYPNTPLGPLAANCAWADRLLPYTRDSSVFECPSAKNSPYITGCVPSAGTDNLDEFGVPVNYKGGYDMNLFTRSSRRLVRQLYATHPDSTISVLDGGGMLIQAAYADSSSLADLQSKGLKPPRHKGGSNVLFLDGHVKWTPYDSLTDLKLWYFRSGPPAH